MNPLHTDDRGWTLYHADYRDTLGAVAASGGADLIAFSPPYCDARSYGMDVSWGMSDYAALGDAVWGALKPGGRLGLDEYRGEDRYVPIKPLHKMTVDQVKKEMSAHALTFERTITTLPWQHILVFRK